MSVIQDNVANCIFNAPVKMFGLEFNGPVNTIKAMSSRPVYLTLRKHTYSNILKILPPKNENFQIKILIFFHISAQNIDCGYSLEPPRRGGSNEYPQSMF